MRNSEIKWTGISENYLKRWDGQTGRVRVFYGLTKKGEGTLAALVRFKPIQIDIVVGNVGPLREWKDEWAPKMVISLWAHGKAPICQIIISEGIWQMRQGFTEALKEKRDRNIFYLYLFCLYPFGSLAKVIGIVIKW